LEPGREISAAPDQTFDEQVESSQKIPDVNERDELVANAIFSDASKKESVAHVIQAIDKISDSNLREHFLEWLYFQRATTALKDRQFEEAEKLASQVEGQGQRAFLHTEIAKGLLKRNDAQTHAQEVLEGGITEAKKAGNTIFAARTLLTASTLYTKIDLGRSISVLADAINCINRIEAPDFSSDDQALEKNPKEKVGEGSTGVSTSSGFTCLGLIPKVRFVKWQSLISIPHCLKAAL
jgi:hypothetical protein